MSNLQSLPGDVLRLVFIASTPVTIRRCQQVCRSFRQIIQVDTYIQYLLDLDACGYVEPLNPRLDLTYSEKREAIRKHRSHWENPQTISPTEYKLQANDDSVGWTYADGVYVWDVKILDPDSFLVTNRHLHFCQLPSPNRGVEHKRWSFCNLGVEAADFAIDPGQDLLVIFELVETHEGDHACNMHLRSMSTNDTHPSAAPSVPILVHEHLPTSFPGISFSSEIVGHLLAVAFLSTNNRPLARLVIWNWTTGVELLRLKANNDCSFTLLAQNLLVVPRSNRADTTQNGDLEEAYRYLDVYQFDPLAITSTEPVRVASFVLPALNCEGAHTSAFFRCSPVTGVPNNGPRSSSFPKVFDVAPDNRILCLHIVEASVHIRTLFFSSSVLLNFLANVQPHNTSHVDVPWAEWAGKTSWVDMKDPVFSFGHPGFGQRHVGFEVRYNSSGHPHKGLAVLDFNQQRIKRALMDRPIVWEVHTPTRNTLASDPHKRLEEAVFCGREDLARRTEWK
ncbi:hypothetical protein BDV93DRAFT_504095 [Ceratobasidium sp. AG-I]|nr:hypothetical protein BDV93DRAFT_504095 [Ceratobasidium sp. AG-I]